MSTSTEKNVMSRRGFITGAALSALALGTVGCTQEANGEATSSTSSAQPAANATTAASDVDWNGVYDVVVVGFGGAGAVAAKTAADAGASVLLVDKAPWGEHGGNTRFSGQDFFTCDDADAAKAYYQAMATTFDYDEERISVFVDGICENIDWLTANYSRIPNLTTFDGEVNEFPMLVEHTGLYETTVSGEHSDSQLWKCLSTPIHDGSYDGKIDVWFSSPATELVQDPATGDIVGVRIDKEGEPVNVYAKRGVVMALGGFENNEEMRQAYLGRTNLLTLGSMYNTGDGIPMVARVGAKIRNVFNWSGYGNFGGLCWDQPEGNHCKMMLDNEFTYGSCLVAGGNGQRYANEEIAEFGHATREDKHGRSEYCGEWLHLNHPHFNHYIFDQKQYDRLEAAGSLTEDVTRFMVSGMSVADLVAQTEGMDVDVLTKTIEDYNRQVDLGQDYQCKRPIDTMEKIDVTSTLYAIPMKVCMMNTQGGPDRDERYQVLDNAGNPIGRLYAVGEFGGIVSNYYQGDGNLSECLVSGRIAGANAAAEAPQADLADEASLPYAIDASYERWTLPEYTPEAGSTIGISENGMGDRLVLQLTREGDAITNIRMLELHETMGVCDPALEQIPAAIIERQTTEGIDAVSGASLTSRAILEAAADAMAAI